MFPDSDAQMREGKHCGKRSAVRPGEIRVELEVRRQYAGGDEALMGLMMKHKKYSSPMCGTWDEVP